MYYCYY